jgi:hypothetical protein
MDALQGEAFKWFNPEKQKNETGSWSYIGTDAVFYTEKGEVPRDAPKMNYGWHEENTDWKREDVVDNFFAQYDKNVMNYTAFDNDSIMLYPVPPEWTTNNQGYGGYPDRNRVLSEKDR